MCTVRMGLSSVKVCTTRIAMVETKAEASMTVRMKVMARMDGAGIGGARAFLGSGK